MIESASVAAHALRWANDNYPEASVQRRAAFANGVALLVTEQSGGLGGPSIREHAIAQHVTGRLELEAAIALAAPIAFGPLDLNTARAITLSKQCSDDDPDDLAALETPPDVVAIIAAWQQGDYARAVVLTELWRDKQQTRTCPVCGKVLSKANRSGYCTKHRSRAPNRRRKRTGR